MLPQRHLLPGGVAGSEVTRGSAAALQADSLQQALEGSAQLGILIPDIAQLLPKLLLLTVEAEVGRIKLVLQLKEVCTLRVPVECLLRVEGRGGGEGGASDSVEVWVGGWRCAWVGEGR